MMLASRRNKLQSLLILGVFILGLGLGMQFSAVQAGTHSQELDQLFTPFWETWEILHDSYVEPVDDEALMEAALAGMLDSLGDAHSFYLDPEMYEIANTDLDGHFEGIGATVRQDVESGALVIIDTIAGAPADLAGLRNGDAIVEVDGIDITELTQIEIINKVRGPEGTTVQLGIRRPEEAEMLIVPVVRARIFIESVQGEVLPSGIGYIKLQQFGAETSSELHDFLMDFDVEHLPGLILDLRGNPGGYRSAAIEVTSEFLSDGVVMIERLREGENMYSVSGDPAAPTVPMVVLVDGGSASASEIVAGALQDFGRAIILGTPTFGKGSVQTMRQLSNGGGVRITIARWYTPDDRSIQDVGLAPDVEIGQDIEDADLDVQLMAAEELLAEQMVVATP